MVDNPVIRSLLSHHSVRRYTDQAPSDEVIETIVRAGQQAAFAYQLGCVLLCRKREKNPFHAPLLFTICVDLHRAELVSAKRGWKVESNDLHLLLFGIEDAIMMAQNMVVAAESLGLGTCYLGYAQQQAERIAKEYGLPKRVFPVVALAVGYPAENLPPRPRYPLEFTLFEDRYPEMDDEMVSRAMKQMDDGYLAQDYYRRANFMITLEGGRQETFTFDDYSWTEHISRKLGQYYPNPAELVEQLALRGFHLPGKPS